MSKSISRVFILTLIFVFSLSSIISAEQIQQDNEQKVILADSKERISISKDYIDILPEEIQSYISENEEDLIASAVTLHVIQKTEDGSKIIQQKTYDLSNKNEFEEYSQDITLLDNNLFEGLENIGVIAPMSSRSDDYGIIVTGLNVTVVNNPNIKNHYQLHGWWEWKTSLYVSTYDRLGLLWTSDFNSNTSTQQAYGNRYTDGRNISISKLAYFFNKGVLWKHNTNYRSYGATLAQITNNNLSNHDVQIVFEYINSDNNTSDSGWEAKVTNVVRIFFNYVGIPEIFPEQRYYTAVVVNTR